MFDRQKYKRFAKMQLSKRWKVPVLMTLISGVLLILLQANDIFNAKDSLNFDFFSTQNSFDLNVVENPSIFETVKSWLVLFIEYILLFSQLNVYIKMSKSPEKITISKFIEAFAKWQTAIVSGLWYSLWVFLWGCLFFIPGIVKMYSYSQMFYLLSEYPKLSVRKAMKISIEITRGHKGELFVMQLSFIGWLLLSCLTCGIGLLWLYPYYNMSLTNAYHGLLKDAVAKGLIKVEDLTGQETNYEQ